MSDKTDKSAGKFQSSGALQALASLGRRDRGSARPTQSPVAVAEIKLGGSVARTSVASLVSPRKASASTPEGEGPPPALCTGSLQMRKVEGGKWRRYVTVLRPSGLCFFREGDDPERAAPAVAFELLKLMVKGDGSEDLRLLCAGEWYELRDAGGGDLRQWADAIGRQRAVLYEQRSLISSASTNKGSPRQRGGDGAGDAAMAAAAVADATQDAAGSAAAERSSDNERVDTLTKRLGVLLLEYHRSSLECEVLNNSLREYASGTETMTERYHALVTNRTRLSDALLGSWKREAQQQAAQQAGAATLSAALAKIAEQVTKLQGSGLLRAIQSLQAEKQALVGSAVVDEGRLAEVNAGITRLRSVTTMIAPCFAQEKLLQRRTFELAFVLDQLERSNQLLQQQVEAQSNFELDVFGMQLDEPARSVSAVLESWTELAALPEDAIDGWMRSHRVGLQLSGGEERSRVRRAQTVAVSATEAGGGKPPAAAAALSSSGGRVGPTHEERKLKIRELSASMKSRAVGRLATSPRSLAGSFDEASSSSTSPGRRSFAELAAEHAELMRTVEAKVAALRTRVGELPSVAAQREDASSAGSGGGADGAMPRPSSNWNLASVASGGGGAFRHGAGSMMRSSTVNDLRSPLGLGEQQDVEYEEVESFANKPVIKSASPDKLLYLIVSDADGAEELRRNVLLTYRLYLTPADLLGRLMLHYTSTPDYESEKMYLRVFALLEPLRHAVVDMVTLWARLHPRDFQIESVRSLLSKFIGVLHDTLQDASVIAGFHELLSVEVAEATPREEHPTDFQGSLMGLTTLPIDQIAAQMTLMDYSILKKVQAEELHRVHKGLANSPNVQLMVEFFNRTCRLLVSQILREKAYDPTVVAAAIAAVVGLGHACKALNNWNGVMICVAVLNTGAVARLADAWALLSREDLRRAEDLNDVVEKNFKLLRELQLGSASPAIPHVALAIRDLTGLEEAPTFIVATGHINYHKIRTMGAIIWGILRHRDVPYTLAPVKRIQGWLMHAEAMSEKEAYQRSKLYKDKTAKGNTVNLTWGPGRKGSNRMYRRSIVLP